MGWRVANLEGRHHLTLFLSVDQRVEILHGDEGGEVVLDRVV